MFLVVGPIDRDFGSKFGCLLQNLVGEERSFLLRMTASVFRQGVIAHFLKLSSKRHRLKPFEVSPHDCKQSFTSNLRTVIAYKRLFSHPVFRMVRWSTKQILIVQKPALSFFAQKIKENSLNHYISKNRSLRVSLVSTQIPKEDKRKESVY